MRQGLAGTSQGEGQRCSYGWVGRGGEGRGGERGKGRDGERREGREGEGRGGENRTQFHFMSSDMSGNHPLHQSLQSSSHTLCTGTFFHTLILPSLSLLSLSSPHLRSRCLKLAIYVMYSGTVRIELW